MSNNNNTRSNFEDAAAIVRQIKKDAAKRRSNKSMADEMLERYPTKINKRMEEE